MAATLAVLPLVLLIAAGSENVFTFSSQELNWASFERMITPVETVLVSGTSAATVSRPDRARLSWGWVVG